MQIIKRSHEFDSAIAVIQAAIEHEEEEMRRRPYDTYSWQTNMLQGQRNAIRILKGAYRPEFGGSFIDCLGDETEKEMGIHWVDDEEKK